MSTNLTPLAKPMLHLGGTSAAELLAQQEDVRKCAYALEQALIAACPHSRDYIIMGPIEGNRQYEIDLAKNIDVRHEARMLAHKAEKAIQRLHDMGWIK